MSDIKFQIGDTTGFICGVKPDHTCNDSGPIMALLMDGSAIPRDQVEDESEVCGGSVSCSICGKPYSLSIFDV